MPITAQVLLIDKDKFAKAIPDKTLETFMVYITALKISS